MNEADDRELVCVNLDAAAAASAAGYEGLAGALLSAARLRAERAEALGCSWGAELLEAIAAAEAEYRLQFPLPE